jgi:hypothetical protein
MQLKSVPQNINTLLNIFFQHLQKKTNYIGHISNLQCGFEKWLQLEFIFWAIKEFGLNPLNTDKNYKDGIGVEHYTEIVSSNRNWKLIDIWLNVKKDFFYYIEFKSIIKDWNEEKQVFSWIDDFKLLQKIDKEAYSPFGIASVLFGTSKTKWTQYKWESFVNNFIIHKEVPVKPYFKIIDQLGIAVIECQY